MKRKFAVLLCLAMVLSVLSGCSGEERAAKVQTDLGEGYPIKGDNSLTYWCQLDGNLATTVKNLGETEYAKELEKRTGVKVEYIHPSSSGVQEAFNIMMASGDLPDIIERTWTNTDGGIQKAYKEESVVKLNDYLETYAPDYMKFMSEHPEYEKLVVTDNGEALGIPFIREDRSLLTSYGMIIRQDWLDDLGLEMPQTMDEIYTVLKAFKEKKNAEVPFSANIASVTRMGVFTSAYNYSRGFFVRDGKVVYGPALPEHKELLATMKKWYDEKLIDNNFATLDQKTVNSNILNGFSGMTSGSGGSALGMYISTANSEGKGMKFAGMPYPVPQKGQKPQFGQISGYNNNEFCAVTADCENIPLAVKFLNYGYTQEGHMLNNFGIEGVSYEMKDGYPTYTELITNNPDELPMNTAMGLYLRAMGGGGSFAQDKRYLEQYYRTDEQKNAWKVWSDTDADKYLLPPLTIDPEKQSEFSNYMSDISTYEDEMFMKFVMGTESLDNYDKYIEVLNSFGLKNVLELYQDAYDRYCKR